MPRKASSRWRKIAGEEGGKEMVIAVPANVKIGLNGRADRNGKPVLLADLRPDDRVTVKHVGRETGREATELSAERVESGKGIIARYQPGQKAGKNRRWHAR